MKPSKLQSVTILLSISTVTNKQAPLRQAAVLLPFSPCLKSWAALTVLTLQTRASLNLRRFIVEFNALISKVLFNLELKILTEFKQGTSA
jgi:hypothetical protein